ncbi:MAG: tat pathway signal sequence domain protein [Rhodobiaceae bacterium]|nr:tat pathway signal sequence domain protein [Rhodobiaceae bacterium]
MRLLAHLPLVAAILFGSLTLAAAGMLNIDKATGLAIKGYDPVAYFADGKAIEGDPAITAEHDGALYRFASAAHRDTFAADPEKYAPQFGGFCAYGIAKGVKAGVEPDKFTIVDGRLYLNYNASVQETWRGDIPGYLAKARENWQQLSAD